MSEETKPKVEGNDEVISLKIKGSDGDEVTFKVKKTMPFKKLIAAYAQKKGISVTACRLVYEGKLVLDRQTPEEHDMEDGDVIDFFLEQLGGGHRMVINF